MNHDEARAQVGALFEGREADVRREALVAHLKGCGECRAFYDRTAGAMRTALGNPDEMTPEELWLFEPPLPPAKVVPLFRPGPIIGLALAASLAGVVLWVAGPSVSKPDDGFTARGAAGGPANVRAKPSVRAVCMVGDAVKPAGQACAAGDTVLFAVTPNGFTHVKLSVLGGQVIGEGDVADAPDTPLPWSVPFEVGLKAKAELSTCATCPVGSLVVVSP